MKLASVLIIAGGLLAGCSSPKHAEAPSSTAGGGSERCRKAAERLVELMSASAAAEPDAIKEITDKVVARCEGDGWTEQTTNCISTLPDKEHLTGCEPMFTDEQKQKLVQAFESSAPKDGASSGAPAPAAAPPAAQPSSVVPPSPPPKHKSDPCEGGQ